jgi:hypothetical protein
MTTLILDWSTALLVRVLIPLRTNTGSRQFLPHAIITRAISARRSERAAADEMGDSLRESGSLYWTSVEIVVPAFRADLARGACTFCVGGNFVVQARLGSPHDQTQTCLPNVELPLVAVDGSVVILVGGPGWSNAADRD